VLKERHADHASAVAAGAPELDSWGGSPGKRTLTQELTRRSRLTSAHLDELLRLLPELRQVLAAREEPEVEASPARATEVSAPTLISHATDSFAIAREAVRDAAGALGRLR
jgi:hypothetical protein